MVKRAGRSATVSAVAARRDCRGCLNHPRRRDIALPRKSSIRSSINTVLLDPDEVLERCSQSGFRGSITRDRAASPKSQRPGTFCARLEAISCGIGRKLEPLDRLNKALRTRRRATLHVLLRRRFCKNTCLPSVQDGPESAIVWHRC